MNKLIDALPSLNDSWALISLCAKRQNLSVTTSMRAKIQHFKN